MLGALQTARPFIVTIVEKPAPQTTLLDVVVASFGVVGAAIVAALVLGAVLAVVLAVWNRRRGGTAEQPPSIL